MSEVKKTARDVGEGLFEGYLVGIGCVVVESYDIYGILYDSIFYMI